MLVLTIRTGNAFTARCENGDLINVRVISTKGGQTRIGIEAKKSISIVRDELLSKEFKKELVDNFFEKMQA